MNVLYLIACRLNQHEPVRRDVEWNGRTYVGTCRYCDTPIERHGRRRWRKRREAGVSRGEPTPT